MLDQFDAKKACGSADKSDFYRFIYTLYFHQDALSWSRTQNLFAVEAGIIISAFSKHGWLAILALLLGSILVFLIWRLIQRDWQARDQYNPYFDEFHREWGVTLSVPPKSEWYRGRHIVRFITWSVITFNLCAALGFGVEMYCKFKAAPMLPESRATHRMGYESIFLAVAIASLLAAGAAAWIAQSSLSQAEQVADRDKRDWKQRKWFDLYFKAGEAYDALDRFQTMYPNGWNTVEFERDWNDLIRTVRSVHTMALVFPKNPAIDAFLSATGDFKDPKEALSKDRLAKILDAVEGLRQNALVDPSVLE